MAMGVGSIAKNSFKLFTSNVFKQLVIHSTRQLYSPNSMGINGYLNAREYVKSQFLNVEHMFFNKMKNFVEKEEDGMIFTEDLKTMLHLVEKKPEDLELMYKMIKKYNNQNNLRFGSFVFGTVAMRAFYHLDEPDLALKAFRDPELNNFFDQIMSHQLLMDLLYNHGKYAAVREVYNITKSKNINNVVHPKNPFILVMGACYKENTKESFDYAVDLFKEAQSRGFEFPRRGIIFLSALALKQNSPNVALEVASIARNVRYIDIRCLKVEAYIALKRFDEILIYFRNSLQADMPSRRKQSYFKDTIEKVEAALANESGEEIDELKKMVEQLKLHEFVQSGTLDEHISSSIEQIRHTNPKPWLKQEFGNSQERRNRNNYGNESDGYQERFQGGGYQERKRTYQTRPGLRDIV